MKFVAQTSEHLKKYLSRSPVLQRQFLYSEEEEQNGTDCFLDPLGEDRHEAVKGLIHKYENRALVMLTLTCAAYCRFCTRKRIVSEIKKGKTSERDLQKMRGYLLTHPEIKELIFSGGDPLTAPKVLTEALKLLGGLEQIKIIRIGTRVPVSEPALVTQDLLDKLDKLVQLGKPVYVMIHFEHPDELTPETVRALGGLRKAGALLFSQSVFLKGVNDRAETLQELFSRLVELGVKPYYIYRCDPVVGAGHFRVPFEKEIEIMSLLRKKLSGLAYPTYVIDTPNGAGKIPVPLNFWEFEKDEYRDFSGEKHKVI